LGISSTTLTTPRSEETKRLKRLVSYATCNHDLYESELGNFLGSTQGRAKDKCGGMCSSQNIIFDTIIYLAFARNKL